MAKRKGSLLRQLTLTVGLVIVFLSLASFYYQWQVGKRILVENIRETMRGRALELCTRLTLAGTPETRAKEAAHHIAAWKYGEGGGRTVTIIDGDGKVLADTAGREVGTVFRHGLLGEAMSEGAKEDGVKRLGREKYTVALPWYTDATKTTIAGGVLLSHPLTPVARLADLLMFGAFGVLVVTLVIMVCVVHGVLRAKVHKPMQAIFMQEYRIREGDLATIDAEDPANEFSDLYEMYNEMVLRIAEQKKAILDQKDHAALARLVRQAISRLSDPLGEILTKSRELLEGGTSLSEEDQTTLKHIIGNITRIVRELKAIVVEGSKSASWLEQEADKIREYKRVAAEEGDEEEPTE